MKKLAPEEMDGFHYEEFSPDLGLVAEIDRFRAGVPGIEAAGTDGCWIWEGSKMGQGKYPYFWDSMASAWTPAGRWAYDHLRGPVDPRDRLIRSCGQRDCVNPFHGVPTPRKGSMRLGRSKE